MYNPVNPAADEEPYLFRRMDMGAEVFTDTLDPYHVVTDGGAVYNLCFGTPDNYKELLYSDVYLDAAGAQIATLSHNPFYWPLVSFRDEGIIHICYDHNGSTYRYPIYVRHPSESILMDRNGETNRELMAAPGTYTLTNPRFLLWGGKDDTEDEFTKLTLDKVTVTGTGVTVAMDGEAFKVTIAAGASGSIDYGYTINRNGTSENKVSSFAIGDINSQPLKMYRWGQGQMELKPGDQVLCTYDSGFPMYIGIGENNPVALSSLSIEPAGSVTMGNYTGGDVPANVLLQAKRIGEAKLYYTDGAGNKELLLNLVVRACFSGLDNPLGEGMLVCMDEYGIYDWVNLPMNMPGTFTFGIVQADGSVEEVSPDKLYTTTDGLKLERVSASTNEVNVTAAHYANGFVRCADAMTPVAVREFNAANSDVTADIRANLLASNPDGTGLSSYVELTPGQKKTVKLRYGSMGASIPVTELMGGSSDEKLVTIQDNKDGTFTLTAGEGAGTAEISHADARDGNGLTVKLLAIRAEDKMLFHDGNKFWGNPYNTYMDLADGNTFYGVRFYYGDASSSAEITDVKDLIVSGPITIEKNAAKGFNITGTRPNGANLSWGTIGYEKDGVVYTMSVQVSQNGSIGGEGNIEARNAIILGGTTFGTARIEDEKITIEPNFGAYYTPGATDMAFNTQVVLAAMASSGDVNTTAYENISDVSVKLLSCVDEYDEQTPCTNASLSGMVHPQIPNTGVSTWGVNVQAAPEKGFKSILAISFTLKDTTDAKKPVYRRITLQANVSYVSKEGDVEIWASDLTTAGKLNVVLSSYEAFQNWLADCGNLEGVTVNGRFGLGGTINLHLPKVDYDDGIVVAQMISDILDNGKTPISQINLSGDQNGGTTMVGMVHKGGLMQVSFVSFEANKNYTMHYGNEHFTCGILADYTYTSTNDMAWDEAYARKYCPENLDTPAETMAASTAKLNSYHSDLRAGSVELQWLNCDRFIGFDYGVRSTANGLVGGGFYGIFIDNFYGVYVDSYGMGVSTGNPHHTDFNAYHFENNVYAVRLVSLPGGSTPYEFRVHDSLFDSNHREFWIRPQGDYYFYRNTYLGYWHDDCRDHWHHHKDHKMVYDDWDRDYQDHKHDKDRPGRYHQENEDKGRVIATAARIKDYNGGCWIYDREDQNNRILKGESNIAIDQESIEALGQDTQVTVVERDSNGNTVDTAVITFRGKGDDEA